MIRLLPLLLVLMFSGAMNAQIINESLKSIREKYKPLFGNESSSLAIDFIRQHKLGANDFKHFLIVKVNNESLEKESISLGYSLFGSGLLSGSSVSSGAQYAVKKANSEVILNREQLLALYDCSNDMYLHINKIKKEPDSPETLAYCEVEGVTIGAETYSSSTNGSGVKFYFKVGNDSVFEMDQSEFEQIMITVGWIKKQWPEMK